MLCGQIRNSISAWRKLADISMRAGLAYKILKYTNLVSAEYEIIEKQRIVLIHKVTGTKPGDSADIKPGTKDFKDFEGGLIEILLVESNLPQLKMAFMDVIEAVDQNGGTLTVSDLAALEPFFLTMECNPPNGFDST